jgi:anti-anti-sigma factor
LHQEAIESVRHQLLELAETSGAPELILDFDNVHYISSPTMGTLIAMHKRLAAASGLLTLCNLHPVVGEVFAVTCLDRLLNVKPAGWKVDAPPRDCLDKSSLGVLVVDNDDKVLHYLGAVLRASGFPVRLATHGPQAVELFRRHHEAIALVVLAALMRGMDGPETLAAMLRISAAVRCCFTIGRADSSTESLLLRLGAIHVFRKPFSGSEVAETLVQLARRSSQLGEVRWIEIPTRGE